MQFEVEEENKMQQTFSTDKRIVTNNRRRFLSRCEREKLFSVVIDTFRVEKGGGRRSITAGVVPAQYCTQPAIR